MSGFTNRWGNIPQLQLPSSIMREGILTLPTAELKVLITLLHLYKSRAKRRRGGDEMFASVKVPQAELMKRTGYTRAATISAAVHGLQEAGFVQIVWDRTGSTKRGAASSEYILSDPDTGEPLSVIPGSSNLLGSLGLRYFTIPVCLLTSAAHRSWAKLSGSEVRLYTAISWTANRERSLRFERTHAQLRRTAVLTSPTFKKALDGLQRHGLIFVSEVEASAVVTLCDPFTGEPIHTPDGNDRNDPSRYFTTDGRRISWNEGTDAQWEQMVREVVPAGEPITKQRNGDLLIRCPFHDDLNPSCFVSLTKRGYHCFGCPKPGGSGTLRKLLAQLTGCAMSDTIHRIARGLGKEVAFRESKSSAIATYDNAIATYDYIDARGIPVKRIVRLPNDESGNKQFRQFKWTENGWVLGVKGVGPVLYNAHRISTAGTVVIVEGEKDADSITNLHLAGYVGETIGVTSGGGRSWHHKLAKQLRHKVVILMPDNDVAGEAYAEAVRASLDAENIKYKTVSFAGTGAKDVTEYLGNGRTTEELVHLIDSDWVRMPDCTHPAMGNELPNNESTEADLVPA
jgi:5S rRNA maturation endonuclease (ribonuclease M5)